MLFVIAVKDTEWDARKIGYRDIEKLRITDLGDIRVKGIAKTGFHQRKGAFDAFREVALFGGKMRKLAALYGEDGVGKMPRRAGDEAAGQHLLCQSAVSCEGMTRTADTGYGSRIQFAKEKRRLLFPILYAEGGDEISRLDHSQQGRERDDVGGRPKQWKFGGQLFKREAAADSAPDDCDSRSQRG